MKTIKRKIVQEGMNKEETMMEDDSVVIKKNSKNNRRSYSSFSQWQGICSSV